MKPARHPALATATLAAALVVLGTASAAPNVSITKVEQRWPWNNKVDITYTAGGQDVANGEYYRIVFSVLVDGVEIATIDGTTDVGASASPGTHTITWTAPAGIKTSSFAVSAKMYPSDTPSGDDYLVVDLATGAHHFEGLLATQAASNARYNDVADLAKSDEYKVNKLVLRKIPAGSYSGTGGQTWVVDRPLYVGMFHVTQGQYRKFDPSAAFNFGLDYPDGINVNDYAKYRPAENVTWNAIRGGIPTNAVAPDAGGTWIARLNARTGLSFDLLTEAQHDVAEYAGATTAYPWGSNVNDGTPYAVCSENSGGTSSSTSGTRTAPVGSKLPNDWGLYDMVGNVWDWCLDDGSASNWADVTDLWTPVWTERATRRGRGNCFTTYIRWFNSPNRNERDPAGKNGNTGFRVALVLE